MSEELHPTITPKAIPCDCCGEPIEYTAFLDVWKEPELGYVCEPCKYRLRIAKVWLKHFKIYPCALPPPEQIIFRNRPIGT